MHILVSLTSRGIGRYYFCKKNIYVCVCIYIILYIYIYTHTYTHVYVYIYMILFYLKGQNTDSRTLPPETVTQWVGAGVLG